MCENIEDSEVRGVDPPYVFVVEILILSYSRCSIEVRVYLTDLHLRIIFAQKVHAPNRVHESLMEGGMRI